ncbi:MAG: hypothetical protein WA973_05740 [Mesorhizobium sp.]
MNSSGNGARGTDVLIARILVAKPELTPDVLRRIVPRLNHLDDHALAQKIAYLKRKGGSGGKRAR